MTMPPMSSTLTPHSLRNLVRAASMSIGRSCFTFRAPLHVMPSDIKANNVGPPNGALATPVYAMRGLCVRLCVGYAWAMHGLCMGYAWAMRGLCMGYAWAMRGRYVGYAWARLCMQ